VTGPEDLFAASWVDLPPVVFQEFPDAFAVVEYFDVHVHGVS
jgi:hypothetical protein